MAITNGRGSNRNRSCVRVIFPPQFEPFQPYLAGPYLKGWLHQQGIESSVFDANIDFYEWFISQAKRQVSEQTAMTASRRYLLRQAPAALRRLKTEPASLSDYRWAVNVLDEFLRHACPTGMILGLTHLTLEPRYSSSHLISWLDGTDNVFRRYYESAHEAILGPQEVTCYLLSVVVIDQLPAAVALAREIRRARPGAIILAGGPLISRLSHQLSSVPPIAKAFDAIIPGEAHVGLSAFLKLVPTHRAHVTPDFSDLDLTRYWSCRRVLPYLAASGCNWGQCAYCTHHMTYDGYNASDMSDVLADLERLPGQHGAEYVSFSDEYLSSIQLEHLSDGLVERNVRIKWSTFTRPEPQFQDVTFLHHLYEAGCRMLMFGLETASQRVLTSMRKGTYAKHYRPILEACKKANIAVRCDFLIGFPGETESDIETTYSFLQDNRDVLDTPFSSYAVAVLEMRSGIPLLRHPDRYGIHVKEPLRGDLDDQYDYDIAEGVTKDSLAKWREKMIGFLKTEMDAELVCPQNKTHQLVLKDLHDQGLLQLPTLRVSTKYLPFLSARLSSGVDVMPSREGFHVVNHTNGGELEMSSSLAQVLSLLVKGTPLDVAYRAQHSWGENTFAQFIMFLYRNDYVCIETVSSRRQDSVLMKEATDV